MTLNQMFAAASEGGAPRDSKLRVTFVLHGVFADDYARMKGVQLTSPFILQMETHFNERLFGTHLSTIGMSSHVLPIAQIEVLPPEVKNEVYVDDIDMSKLEGNLNIFWYGGAAAIIGAIVACTQLLGG